MTTEKPLSEKVIEVIPVTKELQRYLPNLVVVDVYDPEDVAEAVERVKNEIVHDDKSYLDNIQKIDEIFGDLGKQEEEK